MPERLIISLTDEQHEWVGARREKELRARGWRGSVVEYNAALERLNLVDPLSIGQTGPTEDDLALVREKEAGAARIADPPRAPKANRSG
jgi:hypothetical protein